MTLTPTQEKFVLHWGEMGAKWGLNRTVAQIHALLLLSPDPISAEEIATTLAVARSNVSTSLRELQGWGIVRVTHKIGDRKDYFSTLEDVWEMFRIVASKRKEREIDPTTDVLRECVDETDKKKTEAYTNRRMREILDFVETMSAWYDQINRLPKSAFTKGAKLGAKMGKLLGLGSGTGSKD